MLNLALLGAKIGQREQLLRQASLWLAPIRTGSLVSLASRTMPITFSRSTTTTFLGKDGLLKTAGINVPVIEYDVNGNCLGLRVWGPVTNLLPRSEELDSAAWGKDAATIDINTGASPAGSTTADKIVENSTNNFHAISNYVSGFESGAVLTISVYAKAAGRTRFRLQTDASAGTGTADFDLSAVTATAGTGVFSGGSISNAGGGWYRCSVTCTCSASGAIGLKVVLAQSNYGVAYLGDGTSGLLLWGGQIQTGNIIGPYIPTAATAVSSTADVITITGEDFSRIINQTEGTIYIEYGPHDATTPSTNNALLSIAASTTSNANIIDTFVGANVAPVLRVESNSVNQVYLTSLAYDPSAIHKLAAAYKANDFTKSLDTQPLATDTSGTLPAVAPSILEIGSRNAGGVKPLNGYIRELAIFRKVLPSRSLVLLTQ